MNDKMPPPPSMPPSTNMEEGLCLFHKGMIQGDIYTCPSCNTNYCLACAEKAKAAGKKCVKCQQIILLSKK